MEVAWYSHTVAKEYSFSSEISVPCISDLPEYPLHCPAPVGTCPLVHFSGQLFLPWSLAVEESAVLTPITCSESLPCPSAQSSTSFGG